MKLENSEIKVQETLFVEGLLPQLFDSLCMLEKQSFRRRRSQAKECNLVKSCFVCLCFEICIFEIFG